MKIKRYKKGTKKLVFEEKNIYFPFWLLVTGIIKPAGWAGHPITTKYFRNLSCYNLPDPIIRILIRLSAELLIA